MCANMSSFPRLCLSTVSRGELSPGTNRCLHGGGREALPVCFEPHHQRQACKSQQPACSLHSHSIFNHLHDSWKEAVATLQQYVQLNINLQRNSGLLHTQCSICTAYGSAELRCSVAVQGPYRFLKSLERWEIVGHAMKCNVTFWSPCISRFYF